MMAAQTSSTAVPQSMGSTNTVFVTQTRFDPSYLRTTAGILKMFAITLDFLAFICVISSAFRGNGRGVYFMIVALFTLWFSSVLLVLYLFHQVERFHNIPWLKIELVAYALYVFLYLNAATIAVAFGSAAYSAAGFFGYLAMVVYGIDVFVKYRAVCSGELAQGQRVQTKPTPVLTPILIP